jgi:hypothetical protein
MKGVIFGRKSSEETLARKPIVQEIIEGLYLCSYHSFDNYHPQEFSRSQMGALSSSSA